MEPAGLSSASSEDSTSLDVGSERTLYPYVTGTSVLGVKYKDGIALAADLGGQSSDS